MAAPEVVEPIAPTDIQADAITEDEAVITEVYDTAKQYYYIVVGSFQSIEVASQMAEELNRRRPGMSRVFMQTPGGFHRVCFGFYATEDEAIANLQYVKDNINPEAWILFR